VPGCGSLLGLLEYHAATRHSLASVQSGSRELDWDNKPLPFKIYTDLQPIALPLEFARSSESALDAIAGLRSSASDGLDLATLARVCYFANGVTRVLRGHPFRAAACTGALFHIEVYLICGDVPGLEAGVYHYGAHDNALRLLRHGDFRALVGQSQATLAFTTTYWRNAWKYQGRAYRHAFWDTGTVVANALAVCAASGVEARTRIAFRDSEVNALLDVDPSHEATVALLALGDDAPSLPAPPRVAPLGLATRPLSTREVDYPLIREAHAASSVDTAWPSPALPVPTTAASEGGPSIEEVILKRGSSRRSAPEPISIEQLTTLLAIATQPLASDWPSPLAEPYLIANAVDGLASGAYRYHRDTRALELLRSGVLRRDAGFLALGQDLAADAALNVYWLTPLNHVLERLGPRGYRAAQLEAAIEGGKLYLAAYTLGLGATGLTFFDDDVVRFFGRSVDAEAVMFLVAVGHTARRAR
jgi:SagB-type dehydrogenase family enzyme